MGKHDFVSAASTRMFCALLSAHPSHSQQKMGRRKTISVIEREKLAVAWVAASTDPRMGTNQDSRKFWATVLRRFQAFDLGSKLGYVHMTLQALPVVASYSCRSRSQRVNKHIKLEMRSPA
jgi:hypothetical protein